jgi:serine/threonine protein kinase
MTSIQLLFPHHVTYFAPLFPIAHSMGVICYVLLAGYPPFYDEDQKRLFKKIKEGRYHFHEDYWGNTSPEAINLIQMMLCVDQVGMRLRVSTLFLWTRVLFRPVIILTVVLGRLANPFSSFPRTVEALDRRAAAAAPVDHARRRQAGQQGPHELHHCHAQIQRTPPPEVRRRRGDPGE